MSTNSKIVVYLAGSLSEDRRWRVGVMNSLLGEFNVEFLSPVDKGIYYDYRRLKESNAHNRVFMHCDYAKIDRSDVVFAYITHGDSRHSGTSAEIGYARAKGKIILLVNDMPEKEQYLYEFIKRSADEFFPDLCDGIMYLQELVAEMQYSPVAGRVFANERSL